MKLMAAAALTWTLWCSETKVPMEEFETLRECQHAAWFARTYAPDATYKCLPMGMVPR